MAGQRAAIDYLDEYYEPLRGFKTSAFEQLADYYGVGGEPGQTQALYQDVMAGPQYQQMVDVGEQAVMRGAGATGGLRSGSASRALATSSQNILQNLINQRLQGLGGFTSLDTGEGTIADLMLKQAETKGLGTTAAAQARQTGMGNLLNTAVSIGSMAAGMPPMGGFSGFGGGSGGTVMPTQQIMSNYLPGTGTSAWQPQPLSQLTYDYGI